MRTGQGGGRTEVVDIAGVDPPDERVGQAVDDRAPEALPDDLARRTGRRTPCPAAVGEDQVPGHPATPAGLRMPERTSGHHRVGTPRFSPAGMGRSRPRAQMDAPEAPTGTSWSVSPSSSQRLGGLGSAGQEGVGGQVDPVRPANSAARSLPPTRSSASNTCTSVRGARPGPTRPPAPRPRPGRRSPPPTTATVGRHTAMPTSARLAVDGRRRRCRTAVRRTGRDHAGQDAEEAGIVVERPGPGEGHPGRPGHLGRLDVEVVEDLQMVGDEAHRADHHRGGALGRATRRISLRRSGPIHGSGVRPALCQATPQRQSGPSSRPSSPAMSEADSATWSG